MRYFTIVISILIVNLFFNLLYYDFNLFNTFKSVFTGSWLMMSDMGLNWFVIVTIVSTNLFLYVVGFIQFISVRSD